jgi:hypothetical protein
VTPTGPIDKNAPGFALTGVNKSSTERRIRRSESVAGAERRTRFTNTQNEGTATATGSDARTVYNLTVAGCHEYFANGILVHNCDALALANSVSGYEPPSGTGIGSF